MNFGKKSYSSLPRTTKATICNSVPLTTTHRRQTSFAVNTLCLCVLTIIDPVSSVVALMCLTRKHRRRPDQFREDLHWSWVLLDQFCMVEQGSRACVRDTECRLIVQFSIIIYYNAVHEAPTYVYSHHTSYNVHFCKVEGACLESVCDPDITYHEYEYMIACHWRI